jgi:hypothetical protein
VIPLSDNRYVVIEGNRRLAAIKSLLEDHKNGEADLTEVVQASIREIPVLVIDEPELAKREHFARVLQGVRHLSSIRPWGCPMKREKSSGSSFRPKKGLH